MDKNSLQRVPPVYKLFLLGVLTLSLLYYLRDYTVQEAVEILQAHPGQAVVISLFFNILISLAGVLPSVFLTGANTLVFGLFWGGTISWAGEILGAGIAFLLYRFLLPAPEYKHESGIPLLKKLRGMEQHSGFRLILIARLLPLVPSGLVNIVGALSPIPLAVFLWATALGKIPSLVLETFIGHDLFRWRENWQRLLLMLILAGLIYALTRYFTRSR